MNKKVMKNEKRKRNSKREVKSKTGMFDMILNQKTIKGQKYFEFGELEPRKSNTTIVESITITNETDLMGTKKHFSVTFCNKTINQIIDSVNELKGWM
ncbi:hypothetical protein HOC62_03935 [Candidatus Woesearchaeota archaeon]|mgnify:CR=1 FL=1|nr:hypothetical protein [Candidatus Woesearchaeota archaeon]